MRRVPRVRTCARSRRSGVAVRAAASVVGRPGHDPAPHPPHSRGEGAIAGGTRRAGRGRARLGERRAAGGATRGHRPRLRAGFALRVLEPRLSVARGGHRCGERRHTQRSRPRADLRATRHARHVLPRTGLPASRASRARTFRGRRREGLHGAGTLPCGRGRRALDERHGSRHLERELRRRPAHRRMAARAALDEGLARRRHPDPLRVGLVGAHAPGAADREPRRAASPAGSRRWCASRASRRP